MMRFSPGFLSIALASAAASGCFVITDLDSFEQEQTVCGFEADETRDLRIVLRDFAVHERDRTELEVISLDDQRTHALAILDPFGPSDVALSMLGAVPAGSSRIELWADANKSGAFEQPSSRNGDHAWQLAPCSSEFQFTHNGGFNDLAGGYRDGAAFFMSVEELPSELAGVLFELRVVRTEDDRTVALYRKSEVQGTSFTVQISGMIDRSKGYRIDFFFDANGNGAYDAPPTDHAFSRSLAPLGPTNERLEVTFSYIEEFTDIEI